MTFSITAYCPRTGMVGVAVSTAIPGVGGICPFVREGVGAVATQARSNPYLGIDGLELLAQGLPAEEVVRRLTEGDPVRDRRQFGVVDREGRSASWTGKDCASWCGHVTGDGFAVQGNMLTGEPVVAAMAEAFSRTDGLDLPERLLVCLEAGQAQGGDKRGRQSAAVKVFWKESYPWVDLRVDEHRYPVAELRRVFEVARHQLFPFTAAMAKRDDLLGSMPEELIRILLQPPSYRPGGGGSAL